jgi:hypothetical protein
MNNTTTNLITIDAFEKNDNSIEMMGMAKKLALAVNNLNNRAYKDFLKSGGVGGINYKDNQGLVILIDKKYAMKDSTDFNLRDPGTEDADIRKSADLILAALRSVDVTLPELK